MNRSILIFLIELILMTGAFADAPVTLPPKGQHEVVIALDNKNGGYGEHHLFPQIRDWRTLSIKLERSGCFGTCPAYSVTLLGDGTVIYEGAACVAFKGRHVAQVSRFAVAGLFTRFKTANFFSLRDYYVAQITDGPAYKTTIKFDGHEKAVGDYMGGQIGMPMEVSRLEDAIDDVTGAGRLASFGPRKCFGRL